MRAPTATIHAALHDLVGSASIRLLLLSIQLSLASTQVKYFMEQRLNKKQQDAQSKHQDLKF